MNGGASQQSGDGTSLLKRQLEQEPMSGGSSSVYSESSKHLQALVRRVLLDHNYCGVDIPMFTREDGSPLGQSHHSDRIKERHSPARGPYHDGVNKKVVIKSTSRRSTSGGHQRSPPVSKEGPNSFSLSDPYEFCDEESLQNGQISTTNNAEPKKRHSRPGSSGSSSTLSANENTEVSPRYTGFQLLLQCLNDDADPTTTPKVNGKLNPPDSPTHVGRASFSSTASGSRDGPTRRSLSTSSPVESLPDHQFEGELEIDSSGYCNGESTVSCQICNRLFSKKRYLTKHMRRMHAGSTEVNEMADDGEPDSKKHLKWHSMSFCNAKSGSTATHSNFGECQICGKQMRKAALVKHLALEHSLRASAMTTVSSRKDISNHLDEVLAEVGKDRVSESSASSCSGRMSESNPASLGSMSAWDELVSTAVEQTTPRVKTKAELKMFAQTPMEVTPLQQSHSMKRCCSCGCVLPAVTSLDTQQSQYPVCENCQVKDLVPDEITLKNFEKDTQNLLGVESHVSSSSTVVERSKHGGYNQGESKHPRLSPLSPSKLVQCQSCDARLPRSQLRKHLAQQHCVVAPSTTGVGTTSTTASTNAADAQLPVLQSSPQQANSPPSVSQDSPSNLSHTSSTSTASLLSSPTHGDDDLNSSSSPLEALNHSGALSNSPSDAQNGALSGTILNVSIVIPQSEQQENPSPADRPLDSTAPLTEASPL